MRVVRRRLASRDSAVAIDGTVLMACRRGVMSLQAGHAERDYQQAGRQTACCCNTTEQRPNVPRATKRTRCSWPCGHFWLATTRQRIQAEAHRLNTCIHLYTCTLVRTVGCTQELQITAGAADRTWRQQAAGVRWRCRGQAPLRS
jgi:hypothetical protein